MIGSGWHRGGGLVTAILTALGAITLRGSFTPNETLTLAAGGSVLAVAGLLALLAIQANQRGLLYLAGFGGDARLQLGRALVRSG